jgi:hypothetical protein
VVGASKVRYLEGEHFCAEVCSNSKHYG